MPWVLLVLSWGLLAMVLLRLRVRPLNMEVGRARLSGGWRAGLLAFCGLPMVFFTAMTVLCLQHGEDAGIFPLMTLLCALDAGFVGLPCIRWNAEGMSVRNMLGWTRFIPWTGVRGWYWDGGNLWLKTVVGRIFLPPIMDNREALLNAAQAHVPSPDETPQPLIPDLFRGHTRHPARLLAIVIVSAVVGAGMLGQGAYLLGTANASPGNTQQETAEFGTFRQQRQEHFWLYTEAVDYYVPNVADAALLMQHCGTGERFTIWTRPYMDDRAVCRAVGEDGAVYLDFRDFNADQAGEAAFELAAGLLALTDALMTLWVCREPERCPKWLRKLLPKGILAESDGI